jgi:hypothetical protein
MTIKTITHYINCIREAHYTPLDYKVFTDATTLKQSYKALGPVNSFEAIYWERLARLVIHLTKWHPTRTLKFPIQYIIKSLAMRIFKEGIYSAHVFNSLGYVS